MFLLRKLPSIKKEDLNFQSFKADGRKEFEECIASVKKHFGNESDIVKEWTEWERKCIPTNDDVNQYLQE